MRCLIYADVRAMMMASPIADTSFMVQALVESGMKDDFKTVFSKANDFVDLTQVRVDHPDHNRYYRDITKGQWSKTPLSNRESARGH